MLTKNIIVTTSVKTSDELIEIAKNHALNLELDFNYRNKKRKNKNQVYSLILVFSLFISFVV